MENLLRKRLAIIKERAKKLRGRQSGCHAGRVVLDDMLDSGAIVRGNHPSLSQRPEPRQQERWYKKLQRDPLARFKTGDPLTIEQAEPGHARSIDGDVYYLVRLIGQALDASAGEEALRFQRLDDWPAVMRGAPSRKRLRPPLADLKQEDVCFLDIETTGLFGNAYLFLCGLMFYQDGQFVVEQVFARDYAEEHGLLKHVHAALNRFGTVVTYNGNTFDLPFIATRMAVHRMADPGEYQSVDLLPTARTVFRNTLPNCKLITVESHLRGIGREDDIPGRHIPQAYHDFVQTGDARVMKNVLYHNRMDLFAMAVIINRLSEHAVEVPR